nr:insulinase family protein [Acetobacter persici]
MGRPTLGTEDLIRTMSRDTLMRYMSAHYTTGNMVVAAAGNLHHEDVVRQVERHFADLGTTSLIPGTPSIYGGGEFRQEKDLDQAHVVLGFPSVGYNDPDYYAA